jgi:hypothetical protein
VHWWSLKRWIETGFSSHCYHRFLTDTDIWGVLFRLFGYQFSPRRADIDGASSWRIDSKTNYGSLNGLARNRADTRKKLGLNPGFRQ